ncbi:MAG: hypothetical protein GY804_02750 [Alphaproteobacteria bacterium]|nr:hypothetical protein [Alphaproteobacteria bacterium]
MKEKEAIRTKIIYDLDFQIEIARKYEETEYAQAYQKAKEIVIKRFGKTL